MLRRWPGNTEAGSMGVTITPKPVQTPTGIEAAGIEGTVAGAQQ